MAKALATVPALTAHREDNYFRIGGCRCGPSKVGRRVRIRLPPAASLQTLGPSPQQGAGPRLADELEALGSRLRAHRGAGIHDACIPRDWRYAAMPSAGRPRARGRVGSICAVTALSAPMDRADRRSSCPQRGVSSLFCTPGDISILRRHSKVPEGQLWKNPAVAGGRSPARR